MRPFLPASTESLLLAFRQPIALVGNGQSGRELGAVIDRYPTVIRFNNFQLAGFSAVVGTRTTARAVNGWTDLDIRAGEVAISPFTADALESTNLAAFRSESVVPVLHAETDIHALLPAVSKPSTGLALAALLSHLGLEADCFGFDGFASGHYWDAGATLHTTHSRSEAEQLLQLPGITLYGQSFDYASLYDFCHTEHAEYNVNEGLTLFTQHGLTMRGESVIEFGAGNGGLARYLEAHGARVTAMEVSPLAWSRIPVQQKILGDALTLCTLAGPFDRFISVDVLEHLTENDVRIVVREAARLAQHVTVTVCTRPSGLVGPAGENLHLTVRPVRWWLDMFGRWFDLTVETGHGIGQLMLTGERRALPRAPTSVPAPTPPPSTVLELSTTYVSRERPEYFVDSPDVIGDVTWQPDVYAIAAAIARARGCRTIVDIGCGQARKLTSLHPEFRVIGVDYGENIAWCRRTYAFGSWLESDLEQRELLPIPTALLADAVIVCSDVIEHLVDPRALLATLRTLLVHASYVVLTTPDRVRTYGTIHAGPPPNSAHTREWTTQELRRLCEIEGLPVLAAGHTRSNDMQPDLATVALVLRGAFSESDNRVIESAAATGLVLQRPALLDVEGSIASAQTDVHGQPRFLLPPNCNTKSWRHCAEAELLGGVEAETRIFLDAQLESHDVVIDVCPDAGFVALSAATAPGGVAAVIVYGGDPDARENWQQAAAIAGRALIAVDTHRRALLATDIAVHLHPGGRLFMHAHPRDVAAILDACRTAHVVPQLVAICLTPCDDIAASALAATLLDDAGFTLTQLAEREGEVMMQRATAPYSNGVIAIPSALIDVPLGAQALPSVA